MTWIFCGGQNPCFWAPGTFSYHAQKFLQPQFRGSTCWVNHPYCWKKTPLLRLASSWQGGMVGGKKNWNSHDVRRMFVFCGLVPHKRSCRFRSSCAWWKDTAEIPILSRDETTGICQNNNRHLLNLDIPPSLTQTAKKTPENECLEDDSFPFRGAFWPIFKGFVLSNFDSPLLSNVFSVGNTTWFSYLNTFFLHLWGDETTRGNRRHW